MKKTLFKLTLLSLSLILCSCSSSAAQATDNGSPQQPAGNTENIPAAAPSAQEVISADDLQLTYTTETNDLGYESVVITMTNNTPYTILWPGVSYQLKDGLTEDELQAAMPEGFTYEAGGLERNANSFSASHSPCYLEPSESIDQMELRIPIDPRIAGDFFIQECPATQEVLDLFEVKRISGSPIVNGQLKELSLTPGGSVPVDQLPAGYRLLNELPENGKDLILIPDGVELYTTDDADLGGQPTLAFTFYDVSQDAKDKYFADYAAIYPIDSTGGDWYYDGNDEAGRSLSLTWYEDTHVIIGQIAFYNGRP